MSLDDACEMLRGVFWLGDTAGELESVNSVSGVNTAGVGCEPYERSLATERSGSGVCGVGMFEAGGCELGVAGTDSA